MWKNLLLFLVLLNVCIEAQFNSNSLWFGTATLPSGDPSPAMVEFFPEPIYYPATLFNQTNFTMVTNSFLLPQQMSFTFNSNQSPGSIILKVLFGLDFDQTYYGIYSVQDSSLQINFHPQTAPINFNHCENCTLFNLVLQDDTIDSNLIGAWIGDLTSDGGTYTDIVRIKSRRSFLGIFEGYSWSLTYKPDVGFSQMNFFYLTTLFGQLSFGIYEAGKNELTIVHSPPTNETRPSALSPRCDGCSLYQLQRQDTLIDSSLFGAWAGSIETVNSIDITKMNFYIEKNTTRISTPLMTYDVFFVSAENYINLIASKVILGIYNLSSEGTLELMIQFNSGNRPTTFNLTDCPTCSLIRLIKQDENDQSISGGWGNLKSGSVFAFTGESGFRVLEGVKTTFLWSSNKLSKILSITYVDDIRTSFAYYELNGDSLTITENQRGVPEFPYPGCANCSVFYLQKCPSVEQCPNSASISSISFVAVCLVLILLLL